MLGRSVHLRRRFDDPGAARLIRREAVDTLVVMPTLLHRPLRTGGELVPFGYIVSGGAALSSRILMNVRVQWGDVLFNPYGTSEAGLSALAISRDLAAAPATIG